MRVKLDDKHTLVSDAYSCWITEKTVIKEGKRIGETTEKRVSGYGPTFGFTVASYIERQIKSSEAETVVELSEDIKKIKDTVRTWKLAIEQEGE